MRRITLSVSTLAIMGAMTLVVSVPSFADPSTFDGRPEYASGSGGCNEDGCCGGGGGMAQTSGDWRNPSGCDSLIQSCSGEQVQAGGVAKVLAEVVAEWRSLH
jgi:hypothetical protein